MNPKAKNRNHVQIYVAHLRQAINESHVISYVRPYGMVLNFKMKTSPLDYLEKL